MREQSDNVALLCAHMPLVLGSAGGAATPRAAGVVCLQKKAIGCVG